MSINSNCRYDFHSDFRFRGDCTMNDYKVAQIQILNDDGYWTGRTLFVNIDTFEDLAKHIEKLIKEGEIVDSYTTIRKVKLS